MLELLKIKIENLASIENQTYYFSDSLSTIIGINKDTSDIDKNLSNEELLKLPLINLKSNGSGKTSIIEALHICLLGGCIKEKINTRQLIRNGKDSMRIELFCKNTHINLSQIRIVREIFLNKNKTSKLEIFETREGEEEQEVKRSMSDSMDNYILNHYIGLSKEDIDNFFIIQKDKFKSFLLLPDQKKKEILSRFTGIVNFEYIEESLNKEIDNWHQDLIVKDKEILKKDGQIESYNSILNEMPSKEEFEKAKKERIENLGSKIKGKEKDIEKYTINLEKSNKESQKSFNILSIWRQRLNKFEIYEENNPYKKQIAELNNKKKSIQKELDEIEDAIVGAKDTKKQNIKDKDKLDIQLNSLKNLLKNLIECPNCKFKFNPGDNLSEKDINKKININKDKEKEIDALIKEIDSDIIEINKILETKQKDLNQIDIQIKNIRNKILKIDRIGFLIEEMINKYLNLNKKINSDIQDLKNNIDSCKKSINNLNLQIEEIKKEEFESVKNNTKEYKIKITKIKNEISNCEKEKEKLNNQIQLSKDSLLNYGLFKNYLYNKIILEIEYIVNSYLQKFSDLSINIKGNKVLADGKSVRDEINCLITRDNKEISYFLLSSGEKAFIDIAFILTFQKILNITSNNGFNFLILDEITGAIDCANQEELLKAISELNKPILFITHIPTVSDFRTTYIIKENNLSKIIQ